MTHLTSRYPPSTTQVGDWSHGISGLPLLIIVFVSNANSLVHSVRGVVDPPTGADLADPLPERRVARLLGAFIGAGLFFLVIPGTLIGVWNLLDITAARQSGAASQSWIQAHGHAQLFGWVGSFILGISLYALPKFRGAALRSLPAGWAIFGLWTVGTCLRWASSFWGWQTAILAPAAAIGQLAAVTLLLWQVSASRRPASHLSTWNVLIFAGLFGMWAVTVFQVWAVLKMAGDGLSIVPQEVNHWLLTVTFWLFLFPTVAGFAARFLPTFLGLEPPRRRPLLIALTMLYALPCTWLFRERLEEGILLVGAVVLVGYGLRVLEPAVRTPKTRGVHGSFSSFARLAFVWLQVAAVLQVAGDSSGLLGASRHAFTVGFLATLILSMAPRILPSFLNSRELWSPVWMLWSLATLTAGCFLRVSSEPLAYAGVVSWAWSLLPASAFIELSAVLMFAYNMIRTMATPIPAWFGREQVKEGMPVYWYLASYPACRPVLVRAGLSALADAGMPSKDVTLRQAAEEHHVDCTAVMEALGDFFEGRLARTLKNQRLVSPSP